MLILKCRVLHSWSVTGSGRALLASGSADDTSRVWDAGELLTPGNVPSCLAVLRGHQDCVRGVCWGRPTAVLATPRLLTASGDKSIREWGKGQAGEWTEETVLRGHSSDCRRICLLPEPLLITANANAGGVTAISAADDGTVKVWSLENARRAGAQPGHADAITSACWCRRQGDDVVVSADKTGSVACFASNCEAAARLWVTVAPTLSPSCKAVAALVACAGGEAVACAMYKRVLLLSCDDGGVLMKLACPEWANCISSLHQGSRLLLAAVGDEGFIRVWRWASSSSLLVETPSTPLEPTEQVGSTHSGPSLCIEHYECLYISSDIDWARHFLIWSHLFVCFNF